MDSKTTTATGVCYKCGSQRVHRSRRRGIVERIVALAGLRFHRCHDCSTRFARFGHSVLVKSDVDGLLQKLGMALLLLVALLIVVAIVTWLSGKQESFAVGATAPSTVRSV